MVGVGKEREGQPFGLGELGEFVWRIRGNTDDVQAGAGEGCEVVAEVAGLGGAAGGHGCRVGVEQDRSAGEIPQRDRIPRGVAECEGRGLVAGGEGCHDHTL